MPLESDYYLYSRILLTIVFWYGISFALFAQELEPRGYANLPKGMNALAVVAGLSSGNVAVDPSLPIADLKITGHSAGIGYMRTFGLAGKLARVLVNVPYMSLTGNLKLNGQDTSISRNGFGDLRMLFGINLIGSPAVGSSEFRQYQQKTIVGLSLLVVAPTGLYLEDKLVNLGSNRWAFKPELGVSKRFKNIYAEAYSGFWFYTKNNEFLVTKTKKVEPVFSIQGHANYYFRNHIWVGINGNWFTGGQTFVNDVPAGNLKDNWRIGATVSSPLFSPKHFIKLQFHVGAFTNSGYKYSVLTLGYQYVFFGRKDVKKVDIK